MTKSQTFILKAIAVLGSASLAIAYIYFWDVSYNSDYAMIGLFAKSVLEKGERSLYIWQVGYNGMLLEGYGTALIFKWFGTSVYTLNLIPLFFWALLVPSFFYLVKIWHNEKTAWIAASLFATFTPDLLSLCLRTQPNYTQTFLYGSWILISLRKILDALSIGDFKKTKAWFFLAAFLMGYGLYTYGQIIYFVVVFFLYFGDAYVPTLKTDQSIAKTLLNPFKSLSSKIFVFLLYANFLFGVITFCLDLSEMTIGPIKLKWVAIESVKVSAVLWIIMHFLSWISKRRKTLVNTNAVSNVRVFQLIGLIGIAFCIGYLPAIIHTFVFNQPTLPRLGMQAGLLATLPKVWWFINGIFAFLNLWEWQWYHLILAPILFGAIARYLFLFFQNRRTNNTWDDLTRISPFAVLPLVVLPMFIFSSSVSDQNGMRYAIVLVMFFSVAIADCFWWIYSGAKTRQIRFAAIAILCTVFFNAFGSFYRVFASQRVGPKLEKIVSKLDDLQLNRGYANYWWAYNIDFFTNERIILEPFFSNYNPYYKDLVASEDRIAYVDFRPSYFKANEGPVEIFGQKYLMKELHQVEDADIYVLEKLK